MEEKNTTDPQPKKSMTTEDLYQSVGTWNEATTTRVWNKWLWGTDCNALPVEQCWDMNEMHIYGILCAIHESVNGDLDLNVSTLEIMSKSQYPDLGIIHLHNHKKIEDYSIRELLDQIECFQLNFGKIMGILMDADGIERVLYVLKLCLSRLGTIANHTYQSEGVVLDDPQYITPIPQSLIQQKAKTYTEQYGIISRKSLRQGICMLFSLFRVFFIIEKSEEIPKSSDSEIQRVIFALKQHHVESSMDFYNVFQQMIYLAPGMRLVYRTNFAGMYNDVSQVIYFHYPRYCRQPQIALNDIPYSNHHLLPLITQMIPDIPIFYDDDTFIPGLCDAQLNKTKTNANSKDDANEISLENFKKGNNNSVQEITSLLRDKADGVQGQERGTKWSWLVSCGEIFLIRQRKLASNRLVSACGNNTEDVHIFSSEDHSLINLIAFFLKETGRKLGDEMMDADDILTQKQTMGLTAHGHLQIIADE